MCRLTVEQFSQNEAADPRYLGGRRDDRSPLVSNKKTAWVELIAEGRWTWADEGRLEGMLPPNSSRSAHGHTKACDARQNAISSRLAVLHYIALFRQMSTPARAYTRIAEGFFYGNPRQLTRIFPTNAGNGPRRRSDGVADPPR